MSNICMESLARRMKENNTEVNKGEAKYIDELEDITLVFFEKIFVPYLPFANEYDYIRATEEDTRYFMELANLYKTSKSNVCTDWNEEERFADAFMFFNSCGMIKIINNNYYINSTQLKEKLVAYEQYRKNKNGAYVKKNS